MLELNPCPCCGSSEHLEIEASGASESYGRTWQSVTIQCLNQHKPHYCGTYLEIRVDTSECSNSWQAAIDAWNALVNNKSTVPR